MNDLDSPELLEWDSVYRGVGDFDGPPPWDIGEPQPELAALLRDGRVRGTVLDAGCGHAELSMALAARGHTVVGVELSPTAVDAATATARERGLTGVTFIPQDITTFTGFDGRFDTVFDSTLFHSLPVEARDQYLRSVHRAAAPGAVFYVLVFAAGAFPADFPHKPHEVTESELRAAVGKHWIVDDVRPAVIYANPPRFANTPVTMLPHDLDDHGRTKFPAFLLTAHKPAGPTARSTRTLEVPVVDISPWVAGGDPAARAAVAEAVDDAYSRIGFLQVVGHGIAPGRFTDMQTALDAFFAQPAEVKRRYCTSNADRGYVPPNTESLSMSMGLAPENQAMDYFEAFSVGVDAASYPGLEIADRSYDPNIWPAEVPTFEPAVWAYLHEARRITQVMTDIFCQALGLEPGFFDRVTDHSIDVLRLNNYVLPDGTAPTESDPIGMGAHTDYGLVTALWADRVPGLQMLTADQYWHDVIPVEGALVVNVGDLIARITNDHWLSTLHRVKPPVIDGKILRRRSAALFRDGNADAVITTAPKFLDGDAGLAYSPVTVRDHIAAKLAGSHDLKPNVDAVREANRVLSAQESA